MPTKYFLEEDFLEKSKRAQLQESLYAIRERNGKISKLAFLAKKDFEAKQIFTEYLFNHRKHKMNEILVLYRLGTYEPTKMSFNSELQPVELNASDDANNLKLR